MKKIYRKKILSFTVSALMSSLVCQSVSVNASDIDIYRQATAGNITIMFLLDNSGSMSSTDSVGLSRLERVRNGMIDLLAGAEGVSALDDNKIIGLSTFYSSTAGYVAIPSRALGTTLTGGGTYTMKKPIYKYYYNGSQYVYSSCTAWSAYATCTAWGAATTTKPSSYSTYSTTACAYVNGKACTLSYSNSTITVSDQRTLLLQYLSTWTGNYATPTGEAYAEVGAYMLGTTTTSSTWYSCGSGGSGTKSACTVAATEPASTSSYSVSYSTSGGVTTAYYYITTSGSTKYYYKSILTQGSGFPFSTSDAKNSVGTVYSSPVETSATECKGQGIYVLTDGEPNGAGDTVTKALMKNALTSTYAGNLTCSGTLFNGTGATFTGNAWSCISDYSQLLRNRTLAGATTTTQMNPLGVDIKTAVVGFGSDFNGLTSYSATLSQAANIANINASTADPDVKNAARWGVYGGGGWYSGSSSADVVSSVNNFINNLTTDIPALTTGSPTLPQDALNPLRVLPYGYYASFTPTPQDTTQLWVGNLNKYKVLEGQLYASNGTTKLFNTDGSLNSNAAGMWTDGVKGQLPLGITTGSILQRKLYTNRQITNSAASEANTLNQITFTSDYLNTDPRRNYWLNLLGYNVSPSDTSALSTYVSKTPDLRQLGATMHSTPILLTQNGTISSSLDTSTRTDYLLFGTTQGLLHVVNSSGQEVFAFVPNEMMESTTQREAFRTTTASTGGSSNLFYGVDAPWAAYTQYVANNDGSLTVASSDRSTATNPIKGKQWVYGGLRMGGRSYYSLDLGNMDSPTLKFHIDPQSSTITNASGKTPPITALSYMGQSWSKPTIARVKFNGESKLVMIVGGGYDTGYESASYDQSSKTGAGVYMFDADNGSLLWWASANASSDTDLKGAQAVTANTDLKYSVVSQINAIDRDGDGYVDNLYFGDLGGQAFRVDLNNATSTATKNIDARVVRLMNQHVDTTGASPRFYEMPSFSAQSDSSLGLFGLVALSSGNRSSPLAGAVSATGTTQNNTTASTSADDGVFVIYDKDVGNSNLYSTSYTLKTQNVQASMLSLNTNYANGVATTNGGWVYRYGNSAGVGVWKGMNSIYAVDNILYANVYYRDGTGIGGSCGAGVKGDSYLYRFCLPTGKCDRFTSSLNTNGAPDRVKLGAGILGAGLGASNTSGNEVKSTITTSTDCTKATNKNNIECQSFSNSGKIRTLRWYEASDN